MNQFDEIKEFDIHDHPQKICITIPAQRNRQPTFIASPDIDSNIIYEEFAKEHRLATRVGNPIPNSTLCRCCGYAIERTPFNLGINSESLGFIGSGYPLYFDFIKSCLILLCIQWITVGQFMFVANIKQILFLIEPSKEVRKIADILSFTSSFFMAVYMLFFRHNQIKLDQFCDLQLNTPGDYTILMTGLPDYISKEELELKIKEYYPNIAKVTFIYKQIIEIKGKEKEFREKLEETYFENHYFSGSALISFKYKQQKIDFLNNTIKNQVINFLKTFLLIDIDTTGHVLFEGNKIGVTQAPEPTDIHWQHINAWIEQSDYILFLDVLIKFICFILYLYVTCLIEFQKGKRLTYKSLYMPIIVLFNFYGLPAIIDRLQCRKYLSWTQTRLSQSYKLSVTMSLFTICISYYFFDGEILALFASNSFLPFIFVLVQPTRLKRYLKIKFRDPSLSQKEYNRLFELSNHYLARNQAYITYTMIISYYFGGLTPIAYVVSSIGLVLFYWADKYSILRQCTVKHKVSSKMSLELFHLIQFIPLMNSFQHYMQSHYDSVSTIQLVFMLIFYLIPIDLLVQCIWKTKESVELSEYNDENFHESYDRENIALQDKAIRVFIKQKTIPIKKAKRLKRLQVDPKLREKQKQSLEKQLQKIQKQMLEIEMQWEQKQKLNTVSDNQSQMNIQ